MPLSSPCSPFPKSYANKMQIQTSLYIHSHTHFPGVQPFHIHLPSFLAFLTAFPSPVISEDSYLGNAFPTVQTPAEPEPEGSCPKAKLVLGSYLQTKELS